MASTTSAPLIPVSIMPGIYVSNINTARAVLSPNYPAPGRPKIRYVLSLLNEKSQQPLIPAGQEENFVLHFIPLRDDETANLLAVLDEAIDFIVAGLKKKDGGILIHCNRGVSRSAAVAVAISMDEMNIDYPTAMRYVRGKRPRANPNPGFVRQLELWHRLGRNIRTDDGKLKDEYLKFKAEAKID
ncbi:hypothetical protein B0A52_00086 [Exophiala mesophila]|uniref:protein-tyrosine-phosphatase n=1 Tax=Exophiala mesophila TaxID=212818 RepID=A0A438NJ24_EXOME|nr:hypothetical protein B0A52_00086 [Exophiala mesophila]